jgi:hypothetical protein
MRRVRIDELMPRADFSERHSIAVRATPERAYDAIGSADLAGSPIVRLLLALRGMKTRKRRRLANFDHGFTLLANDPPRELVLGVEGPFWNPRCRLREINAESFTRPVPEGVARAAWNFTVAPENGGSRVTTETRILCADDARAKFRLYWLVIRPFSGLIRRMMLRAIRAEAER